MNNLPELNSPAPDFSLPNQDGKIISLSDFKGKKIILYFYPKDNTPGCTTEACDFRDNHQDFSKCNAVILGISMDSTASHKKFLEKQNLNFDLLADTDGNICSKYGVIQEKNTFGKKHIGIVRTTFIIDETGKIEKVFPKVSVNGHWEKVMEALQ